MFTRVSTFKCDPARVDEVAKLVDKLGPAMKEVPGLLHSSVSWRNDGSGVIVAIYESEGKAARAVERIQAVWSEALELLIEPPQIATYRNAAITF